MPLLTAAAAKAFLSRFGLPIGIALAFGVILMLAFCKGQQSGRSGEVVKQQERTIETQQKVGKSNDQAASERVADETRLVTQRQELKDAQADATSGDDRRARRGCTILRQQGRDLAAVPACRRFAGSP